LSVKFLDDYKRNPEFNEANPTNPPRKMIEAISPQSTVQGENPVEMVDALNSDLLMEEIGRVKENLKQLDAQDGRVFGSCELC
jgi:predicted HAD superfamily phosphohydrolase